MKSITRAQFSLAEQVRNRYSVTVDQGATLEEMLKEEATQHIAAHLRIGDILEVVPVDQAWYAELMVKSCGRNFAKFNVLQYADLVPVDHASELVENSPHEVTWGGPHQKYRVIRKADGSILKDGFADKASANKWATEHEKA